jgi:hypothetical protein
VARGGLKEDKRQYTFAEAKVDEKSKKIASPRRLAGIAMTV